MLLGVSSIQGIKLEILKIHGITMINVNGLMKMNNHRDGFRGEITKVNRSQFWYMSNWEQTVRIGLLLLDSNCKLEEINRVIYEEYYKII